MQLSIIGRGRLGRSLAMLLQGAGWEVGISGRGEPVGPAPVVLLAVPDGAIDAASALSSPAARQLAEVLEARASTRREALETLAEAPGIGVGLRPLLLPQSSHDPDAEQVARWLVEERAA